MVVKTAVLDMSPALGKRVLVAGSAVRGYYGWNITLIPMFFAPEKAIAVLRKVPYSYEDGCGARHRCLVKTNAVFKGGYKLFPEDEDGKTVYVRRLPYGYVASSDSESVYARGWFVFEVVEEGGNVVMRPSRDRDWDFVLIPFRNKMSSRVSCAKLYHYPLNGFSSFATSATCCAIESVALGFVLAEKGATFLLGQNFADYREKPDKPIGVYHVTVLDDFNGVDKTNYTGDRKNTPFDTRDLGIFRSMEDAAESLSVSEELEGVI